jgi:acyl transferase domain-containing protein
MSVSLALPAGFRGGKRACLQERPEQRRVHRWPVARGPLAYRTVVPSRSKAAGGAYVFDGGYLPRPYDFDIGVFGMSPREAVQVDPQQRLLAELVWEALENARVAPADIAGKEVGVYIGVSALDHANLFGGDPARSRAIS